MSSDPVRSLLQKRQEVYEGGGPARIATQHEAGKLTARERLALLFDPDTFQELNLFVQHRSNDPSLAGKHLPGDGVVTGLGGVDGRVAYVASQDFTVAGGSVGEGTARKIREVMDAALKTGCPFVFINDGAGARIQEGVDALSGYGDIFFRNVLLSGVVPQISIIAGPCAGGAAYSPALTDFIIQVRNEGQIYITGPKVIKEVTGEEISAEALGGVESHAYYSGVVHFVAESDEHAVEITKRLLSFLPSNNAELCPFFPELAEDAVAPDPMLEQIVPVDPRQPYDVRNVITHVVDRGDFLEIQEHFAPNIVIGLGRIQGHTVGVVGNQPIVKAGVLDIDCSDKASRFIRFCNAFSIPILTFVDVPGFLPGVRQEYGGIVRHGAKMLFAYAAATVPKITILLRKAYGGAYLAMCAKSMGADRTAAWPNAEIAVMGPEGAVNVLHRKQIQGAEDPAAERKRLVEEYTETYANPYLAAERGMIDNVILPAETRPYVAAAFSVLRTKREIRPQKKHGLIPL
ncbi:MAG: acyl-CoA carboxylase subunit beta [Candidatus Eisenbacteria bacterium]|uniref:Acyl-CoA carboxylase subunit beta n=1 Tax=Eiseniibacteriota bacterium TaxID=2212470 RepID=A0A956NDJ5_UNCEI|nr:acyl-CoA carboxylase subunit beta [Candidatus Eisenbacteria bacterium]